MYNMGRRRIRSKPITEINRIVADAGAAWSLSRRFWVEVYGGGTGFHPANRCSTASRRQLRHQVWDGEGKRGGRMRNGCKQGVCRYPVEKIPYFTY